MKNIVIYSLIVLSVFYPYQSFYSSNKEDLRLWLNFMNKKIKPFILFVIVICLNFLITACNGTHDHNGIVRVMTFNLHHCEGEDSVYDVERIARFIQEQKADIILCQEVDRGYSDRSKNDDQPKMLAGLLGFHSYYGPNIGDSYGNLVLSRYPLVKPENIPLPNPEDKEPRGIIVSSVSALGRTLTLLNTHLSAFSALNREKQIEYLTAMTSDWDGPVVFGADFNTTPSKQLKPLLENDLLISSRRILGIEEAIDDILVSPILKEYIVDGDVVPTDYSDHPAYWIDIDVIKYRNHGLY